MLVLPQHGERRMSNEPDIILWTAKRKVALIKGLLAARIKAFIEEVPVAGYRATVHLLGLNKNTVQRISQPKGWQVHRMPAGNQPESGVNAICGVTSW